MLNELTQAMPTRWFAIRSLLAALAGEHFAGFRGLWIFGLLVVESLIFGWIFGGYGCHAFVIWPSLGCFYIFFCRKAKPLPPLPEHVMAWVHNADAIWVAMMMTTHKRYSLTETQHSKRCLPKRKFHLPTCIFLVLCFFSGVYQIDRSISD